MTRDEEKARELVAYVLGAMDVSSVHRALAEERVAAGLAAYRAPLEAAIEAALVELDGGWHATAADKLRAAIGVRDDLWEGGE